VVTNVERAWDLLEAVPDPEIPVLSIREMGILRDVRQHGDTLQVVITPTYSGCPAIGQIEDDVRALLARHGLRGEIATQLAPAWTTDWMSPAAKDKLRAYGIAPPHTVAHDDAPAGHNVMRFARKRPGAAPPIACPHCGSEDTTETSHFGSTACKALYKCLACLEPFDHFKPY
jgi:ring-1,2-phenylacetyl-CoA epoxidase subunit PaaD